jgi:hypothetical protein
MVWVLLIGNHKFGYKGTKKKANMQVFLLKIYFQVYFFSLLT